MAPVVKTSGVKYRQGKVGERLKLNREPTEETTMCFFNAIHVSANDSDINLKSFGYEDPEKIVADIKDGNVDAHKFLHAAGIVNLVTGVYPLTQDKVPYSLYFDYSFLCKAARSVCFAGHAATIEMNSHQIIDVMKNDPLTTNPEVYAQVYSLCITLKNSLLTTQYRLSLASPRASTTSLPRSRSTRLSSPSTTTSF